MHKAILVLGFVAALSGCVSNPPQKVNVSSLFDAAETKRLLDSGPNVIRGSALIRQRGGGVVSCAGMEVALVPATSYASERILALYGSTEKGFNSAGLGGRRVQFENEPLEYRQLQKKVTCDAQGFFKFDQVANGSFFVTAVITWKVNDYFLEGGALMQRLSVAGGETKEIVLAP